nr:hypothetical protein [Mesorhizobium sp.]
MLAYAIDKSRLATDGKEYLKLLASNADWIIRDKASLMVNRKAVPGLAKLPDADFRAFADSLEFKGGGLAHGNYRPLMMNLTLTELFEVFEAFGMGRDYFLRIHEYDCAGGGCSFSFWSFCASNCHPAVVEQ